MSTADEHVSGSLCKLEPQSKTIGVDSLHNHNPHKYSMNAPFNGAFALKSTLQLVMMLAKTAISSIFHNFWRNRRNFRNRSFCWTPLYLLYHLHLVILAKTAISPIFRNFYYCLQTWTYLVMTDVGLVQRSNSLIL